MTQQHTPHCQDKDIYVSILKRHGWLTPVRLENTFGVGICLHCASYILLILLIWAILYKAPKKKHHFYGFFELN